MTTHKTIKTKPTANIKTELKTFEKTSIDDLLNSFDNDKNDKNDKLFNGISFRHTSSVLMEPNGVGSPE